MNLLRRFWRRVGRGEREWDAANMPECVRMSLEGNADGAVEAYRLLAEAGEKNRTLIARALQNVLRETGWREILAFDRRMRQTKSLEFSLAWEDVQLKDILTAEMRAGERFVVCVFSSFHPSGFVREQAVRALEEMDGALVYIALRLNDWVPQVRSAARNAAGVRRKAPAGGELLAAIALLERVQRSSRAEDARELLGSIRAALCSPVYRNELLAGLSGADVCLRRACTNALVAAAPEDGLPLLKERLVRERDALLRRQIFAALLRNRESARWAVETMLGDRMGANRRLALEQKTETDGAAAGEQALRMLWDPNASVRKQARAILRRYRPETDVAALYLARLPRGGEVAALGVCETGTDADIERIAPLIQDQRAPVVCAAMRALARLRAQAYVKEISDLLGDARTDVSRTARKLLIRCGAADCERVWNVLTAASAAHVKRNCAKVLFAAEKWVALENMLRVLRLADAALTPMAEAALARWLGRRNRSFAPLAQARERSILRLLEQCAGRLPRSTANEIRFCL